jgi:hypothetical protein
MKESRTPRTFQNSKWYLFAPKLATPQTLAQKTSVRRLFKAMLDEESEDATLSNYLQINEDKNVPNRRICRKLKRKQKFSELVA